MYSRWGDLFLAEPRKYKYLPERYPERRELKNIDVDRVVKYLLSAFADEVIAYYMYLMAAYAVRGNVAKELEDVFVEIGRDELEDHAKKLADRLQDFDVDLPDFRDLWSLSRCKYPDLPEDPYDVDEWLQAAVEAEKCAIKHYREIYDYVVNKDIVTEEIVEDILEDEVKHETIFRTLISKARAK